jgi:hypothetical protein
MDMDAVQFVSSSKLKDKKGEVAEAILPWIRCRHQADGKQPSPGHEPSSLSVWLTSLG